MLEINKINNQYLNIDHWSVKPDECWAVIGRNGSGKRQLGQLIDQNKAQHDFSNIALLSFEQQQAFYEEELKKDDTDFMDKFDPGTTVKQILNLPAEIPEQLEFLGLDKIIDRGYRLLSSGESRKVLLAQVILQQPDLLILDEPFDSLDLSSKQELAEFFQHYVTSGDCQLLFLLNSIEEVFNWHTHVAIIEKGELIAQGSREDIIDKSEIKALLSFDAARLPSWPTSLPQQPTPDVIIELINGKVSYGDTCIFSDINLLIKPGEHTLITGPNGSGKSTLLNLFSGDHPQSYGNDLTILGFKRGSGESIWQLKKHIGIVSPDIHRNHRVPGSALEIVLSGFFDSIGLYEAVSSNQVDHARQWLTLVGLGNKHATAFKQLSYGEQRLSLIARALVKQPSLLLLDEPTQGLDDINRHRLIYFLEHLSCQDRTTIILASHRQDEHLPLFTQHVELD